MSRATLSERIAAVEQEIAAKEAEIAKYEGKQGYGAQVAGAKQYVSILRQQLGGLQEKAAEIDAQDASFIKETARTPTAEELQREREYNEYLRGGLHPDEKARLIRQRQQAEDERWRRIEEQRNRALSGGK
jgi:hypothetical protein